MVSQINPPVILAASPDNVAFDKDPGVSYSDELTLVGTATAYSTITVYDGTTALGTTTANSAGVWSYATPSLTDGAHSFTATATVAGVTSVASSAMTQTIAGAISNFSPLTDQWSSPISVGGMPYYAENANINGNAPWAITQLDSHTIRFEVRPNDIWAGNDSHRSEISGGTVYSATSTIDLSYQFTVQPGFNDTSNNLDWQILGQFHADDNDPTYLSINGGNPPFAFHLTGANGSGEGDYLAVQAFYALPGQKEWTAATLPSDPLNGYLWVSPTPIVRGQAIDVHVEANFQNNASGFLEVWINGQQVVDYHGALGYGGGVYWKEGIYEGWSSDQSITVDYANTSITTKPGAPLILGNVVNGNQVMLNGTAQANSIITIYDGSTKLGTATTSSNGLWFYETNTLAVGGHSLSATATDNAGNVGAASAASATIAAFTGPIVTQVTTSAQTGETVTGNSITFTLKTSSVVSVTGTPTLTLNNGGTAVYSGGSGTNTLTFTYTVGANDSIVKGVAITGANLPNGASITDSSGNAAILTGASVLFPGVIIDTQPVKTPVFGDPVDNGNGTFTFTGTAGANTTVYFATSYGTALGSAPVDSNGRWTFTTPTLAGNTWTSIQAYNVNSLGDVSAIGSENGVGFGNDSNLPPSPTITGNALVGNVVTLYGSVEAGYSISKVTIFDGTTQIGTASINSNNTWSFSTNTLTNGVHNFSAKVTNAAGTSSGSVSDPITVGTVASPVDTTAPTVSSLVASGSGITSGNGTLGVGGVVTLTMNLSEAVTVSGGTPTLTLNNGGTATYAGGSGTNALAFSYTVGSGQNTSDLAVTAVNLNSAVAKDSAGNIANLAGAVTNPSGTLQINTAATTVSSVAASGAGITSGNGILNAGDVVTLTVNLSSAVTVVGGTPTLALNGGGTATYAGGSGTNALTFSYTVGAGQNTSDLAVTAVNLNSATVKDGAGNTANLAGAVTNPSGTLQIDTTAPTVSSLAASGTGITSGNGILNAGDVVTLTVNLNEAVTVAGGTPSLKLNNGGVAAYTGGSGTKVLTFSYTVGAGQNTSDLAVTAVNLNSATVKDSAGNTANLAGAVTNPSGTLQIDTTTPTVSSVAAAGTGITSGNGILNVGDVVTLTVNLDEAVTVAGGTPTLKLNNGGVAAYTGGSGTKVLTFSYTVGTGQNTSDLAVTAVNLNSATVKDSAGNTANLAGAVTNPSGTLQIDTTTLTIEALGATSLVKAGRNYYMNPVGGGSGPVLKYGDASVVAAQFGVWTPVAAEKTSGGYQIAWQAPGSNQFIIWNTDAKGNYLSNTAALSGDSITLEQAETSFRQDLNGDGTIGVPTTVSTIESSGSTSLVQVGANFYLNPVAGGSGPQLKYAGSAVVAEQFGVWTPVAVEKTSSGYQIAWQAPGTNQFIIWYTDSSGNYRSNTGVISGTSASFERAETSFHQDLNGNGVIGVAGAATTAIESLGSTSLAQVGTSFNLTPVDGGSGLELNYYGSPVVAAQFGVWTPIGAEQTSTGYLVAWQAPGTDQFILWTTDSNGNYLSDTGLVLGSSAALQRAENTLHQDLNGDGVIVLSGSGTVIGSNSLIVGSGASVELVGAYSGTVRFAGATGSLIIDQSTQFGGTISGQLTKGDLIDLRDITAGAGATVTYSGNNSPGNLSVSDGTNTATIALSGNYSLGNFIVSSDGNGGTLLVDPPLSTAQGNEVLTNGSESKSAWLDSIDSKLALWSQHIASAFSSSPFDTSSSGTTVNSETGRATPTFQLATSAISQQQYPS